ncbi:hypothetical protein Catovirus_1_475 [Catovirus CTV1]|uniref:Uncharacterized protein n=1 Tax=Catovirus CTV1 TaxID=1977631 RepID=A0A1V0S9N0_9VIRU|nr:hypothetical protein Catovirus_1_475 [Catovirus CTV1]
MSTKNQIKDKLQKTKQEMYDECLKYYSNLVRCTQNVVIDQALKSAHKGRNKVSFDVYANTNNMEVYGGIDDTYEYSNPDDKKECSQTPKFSCHNMIDSDTKKINEIINAKAKSLYDIDVNASTSYYKNGGLYYGCKW